MSAPDAAPRPVGNAQEAPAVQTRALRKVFGSLVAVDNLDLMIHRGEVFGLLGPNGSGKTTTIRMLCGLLEPTSGDASVVGFTIPREAEPLRAHIGYMSQRFGLYGDLTVRENVAFYAALYGLRGASGAAAVERQLSDLGLTSRATQLAATLSGGWKQRVALACATTHRPRLLFLDEPTAGVDPAARRAFWSTIYDMASSGITVLVTTHYMDEAERCSRVAFLSRGHLIALGSPDEIPAQFGASSVEDVFVQLQAADESGAAMATAAR